MDNGVKCLSCCNIVANANEQEKRKVYKQANNKSYDCISSIKWLQQFSNHESGSN